MENDGKRTCAERQEWDEWDGWNSQLDGKDMVKMVKGRKLCREANEKAVLRGVFNHGQTACEPAGGKGSEVWSFMRLEIPAPPKPC